LATVSHLTKPGRVRVGYVGEPHKGVEQRIAADGEIQVKSPGLMMGYFKNEEATKDTITEDGWLRTGDKGELDELGRLKITGRTKEIFKTSKGKYVAPAPIENQFISHPRVELACVGGRGYQAAHIIVMLGEHAKKEARSQRVRRASLRNSLRQSFSRRLLPTEGEEVVLGGEEEHTPRRRSLRMSFSEKMLGNVAKEEVLSGIKIIEKELEDLLKTVNSGLDDHEKVQFIAVVNDVWEPENGFLTPTNKIKRARIEEEYGPWMDDWYDSEKKVIWHMW
jgi:long-chain acyl-CoA synthetase